eukprot:g4804.t1
MGIEYTDNPGQPACKSAACKPGTYGTATTADKPPTCSDCASGRYNSAQGLTSASDCSECPLGRWSGAKGATSLDQCIKCEAGKFGNTSGASEENKCYACKRGIEYTDQDGQPACKSAACERGKYGNASGQTSALLLPTIYLIRRRIRYRRKYAVVKLGKRRCCRHRWRLDFPRQSRFSRLDVAEGAKLGNGAFGEVNQGTLQVGKAPLRIAVKHVLESKATDVQRHDTIVECRLQCELDSPFLVKCFGFTTGPGPGDFSILLELMDIGDLPQYMESVVKKGGRIAEATRLRWMIEIASALEYMHASNLIHADLAARNLVLYHSKTGIGCKVTDFGLSHSIDPKTKTYMLPYGGSVPFHWTAPECLPCNANFIDIYSSSGGGSRGSGGSGGGARNSANTVLRLTPANDVWAFGVTVWEIEGLAANGKLKEPFEQVPHKDLYDSLSTKKAKLEFEFRCRDKTIDTFKDPAEVALKSCLRVRPWVRASMTDIRRRLQVATLCDAVSWGQDDVQKWLDRMGAPRVDDADLWELDDYDDLMTEILNDVNRPEYVAGLKGSIDDDALFALSGRLQGELAGLTELMKFLDGDTCPKGDVIGHPDQFTWLAERDNQTRRLRTSINGVHSRSAARLISSSIYGSVIAGQSSVAGGGTGNAASAAPAAAARSKSGSIQRRRTSAAGVAPSSRGGAAAAATPGSVEETKSAVGQSAPPSSAVSLSSSTAASTASSPGTIELTVLGGDGDGNNADGAGAGGDADGSSSSASPTTTTSSTISQISSRSETETINPIVRT